MQEPRKDIGIKLKGDRLIDSIILKMVTQVTTVYQEYS